MIQYNLVKNTFQPDLLTINGLERPPMIEVEQYRAKFNIN
jgi:glucosyl-3-phosphoglycerate synthase